MPSNMIIFDAEYISELTAKMNIACDLMAEAVSSFKSAQSHENWKCKERNMILEDFEELNLKLGRLDSGVNDTTRILGGSVSRFAALESRYESQANTLSDELTSEHGFSASVRTEGNSPNSGLTAPGQAAGSVAGAGVASAGVAGEGRISSAGTVGAIAGRIPGMRPGSNTQAPNTQSGGAVTMNNVNLPVTHIPDNPDAAAKGTKASREIAHDVVGSVAHTMAQALSGQGAPLPPELVEAYNAGRRVFESSAAIMANPNLPHTEERLAMAAGLVTLAENASNSGMPSVAVQPDLARNAGSLSDALQDNSEAQEFRQVLGVFASAEEKSVSSSSSSGKSGSFFDMIVAELKKAFTGTQDSSNVSSIFTASSTTSSSAGTSQLSSSPIMEFLGNFVMDQAV